MEFHILDNNKIKFHKGKNIFIYINENLSNKKSIKYYIEKNKISIRREISFIIKEEITYKVKKFFLSDQDRLIWDMSSIFEMNVLRSNSFFKLAQLICIRDIIKKNNINKIIYYGSDINIINFLKKTNLSLSVKNHQSKNSAVQNDKLYFLRGIFYYFKYLLINFFLILTKDKKTTFKKNILFLSYLVHIEKNNKSESFSTNHWGSIPSIVNSCGYGINWHYDYSPSHELPNSKRILNHLKDFKNDKNSHNFLSSNLSFLSFCKVFINFLLYSFKFNYSNIHNIFRVNKLNKFNIYEIFKNEFKDSFNGPLLIYNLFYIEIFKNLLSSKNKIENSFFLLENQPWEKAFRFFWKKYKHKNMYGCVNSTTIFWDMRYYHHNKKKNFKELKKILINGDLAENYFKKCLDLKKLIKVEAVRYKYLLKYKKNNNKKTDRILILGEHSVPTTISCLDYLKSMNDKKYLKFDFKPHPTTSDKILKMINEKYLNIRIIKHTARDIYSSYKNVIVIGSTSGIIEAIYFGLNILVYDESDNFLLCPISDNYKIKVINTNLKFSENMKENLMKIDSNYVKKIALIKKENNKWLKIFSNL